MKSKQINFYITQEDVNALYQLVRSLGWCVIPARLDTARVSVTESNPLSSYLALKSQINYVRTKKNGASDSYKVQIINSPAIEFWAPPVDHETRTLHRGRIYFTCEYFNDSALVEKNSDFLNASKSLMLSIRKYLRSVKSDELGDMIISQNAQKWIAENQGKIALNNIPA